MTNLAHRRKFSAPIIAFPIVMAFASAGAFATGLDSAESQGLAFSRRLGNWNGGGMTATGGLIDVLKRRAGDMARGFIDAARQPDATESERAFGEAARSILRDAEARARLLPRREFEQRVKGFKEWHRRHEAAMRRELAKLSRCRLPGNDKGALLEARRRAVAELDRREAEFHRWVDGYALAAWIRATEDLLTLDRPSAFICSQHSPSRH
jgi:hypothetical protein